VAKAGQSSKFAVNDLLFKPEPPVAPRDVKELFKGRAAELERGRETLKANLDLEGERSKRADKRPWVVHGESRSGKSHLARRIFADIPPRKDRIQCLIPSGGRLDALAVMRDLFETLRGEYKSRIWDQTLTEDPLKQPAVQLVEQLVEKIGMFASGVQAVELTHEAGERDSVDLGAELGGAPLLFKFLTKYQTERTQKNAIKVTLRAPVALDLAEVCGIMVEALLRLQLVKHALILVDDVDLLEGYVSAQQNARQQRPVLAAALHALHGTPGVDVVLTARSWYAHAQKDLSTLVDLALAQPMTPDELAAVHDSRLGVYGGKSGIRSFLSRPALRELANDVDSLPGVFIQHLGTAFYHYQNEAEHGERDYDWFLGVFRRRLPDWRDKCGRGLAAIEQAMRDGRRTVDVTDGNPFFGTVLDNEFVHQSYDSETTYFISGVMRRLLRESVGPGGGITP
jgi:hypothetical protein